MVGVGDNRIGTKPTFNKNIPISAERQISDQPSCPARNQSAANQPAPAAESADTMIVDKPVAERRGTSSVFQYV